MSEEKQHHHGHFHHRKEEEEPVAVVYSENVCGVDADSGLGYETTDTVGYVGERPQYDYEKEGEEHKRKEHLGEMGAAAAGAFALYEKHETQDDPEHKHRHKIEEDIAGVVAVGAGGYTFHEHHEKKEASEEEEEMAEGKKHHHLF